jgi:hypothetical protein
MHQMRKKSSSSEPTTDPRTEPTMTPAWLEWDDSPWIADEDKMVDETDEGDEEGVVGEVAGGEVVKLEDCDGDGDGDVVEGSTDTEVGVAMVEEDMTDPELAGIIVGRLDDDGVGEDEPPKTQTLSEPSGI